MTTCNGNSLFILNFNSFLVTEVVETNGSSALAGRITTALFLFLIGASRHLCSSSSELIWTRHSKPQTPNLALNGSSGSEKTATLPSHWLQTFSSHKQITLCGLQTLVSLIILIVLPSTTGAHFYLQILRFLLLCIETFSSHKDRQIIICGLQILVSLIV